MSNLHRIPSLLGPMVGLKDIRPPGRSFEDWERWLREAAPIALDSPLGMAIERRYRWLRDSRERGLSYAQAEAAWDAGYERERAAIEAGMRRQDEQRHAAQSERNGKKHVTAKEAFDHAREVGL